LNFDLIRPVFVFLADGIARRFQTVDLGLRPAKVAGASRPEGSGKSNHGRSPRKLVPRKGKGRA
jgi:hypothetical protein